MAESPITTITDTSHDDSIDQDTTHTIDQTDTSHNESSSSESPSPHHNVLSRLYTGTGAFDVLGHRKMWYIISGTIVAIALVSILIRGFSFGIDFSGGTKVSFPKGQASVSQVKAVFEKTLGQSPESVVIVGTGTNATIQIRSETLDNNQIGQLRNALFDRFHPKDRHGLASKKAISDSAVSETWGKQITQKAIIALVVFLALASLYITIRYEKFMALSAMISMIFDVFVSAGIYSLVGFEVTPATVIGLLTILGFSLYDTVIVFDKVEENTHGFEHTTRRTYAEQANLAINQTFMRSLNTSIISILPVLALMIVAVWLYGVGTLKDLALVQLVGIITGTYSSIFFATPLLVTMRERTELVRKHTERVLQRRGQYVPVTPNETALEISELPQPSSPQSEEDQETTPTTRRRIRNSESKSHSSSTKRSSKQRSQTPHKPLRPQKATRTKKRSRPLLRDKD